MKQIRQTKANMLTHEYELFHMREDEKFDEMFERLSVIVNNLDVLGKTLTDEEFVTKVLRSLIRPWLSKIFAIQEGRDISALTYDELRGNLIAYETTHLRNEVGDKKKKSLTLKFQDEEDFESENETDLRDEIAIWSKRITRMMRKRGKSKKKQISRRDNNKTKTSNKDDVTFFGCGKQGHFKSECPELKRDAKKKKKKKALMSTWEDLENDSSNDDDDEAKEVTNLCFMAN